MCIQILKGHLIFFKLWAARSKVWKCRKKYSEGPTHNILSIDWPTMWLLLPASSELLTAPSY